MSKCLSSNLCKKIIEVKLRPFHTVLFLSSLMLLFSCDNDSGTRFSNEKIPVRGGTVTGATNYKMWNDDGYKGCFEPGSVTTVGNFLMAEYETTRKEFRRIMSDSSLNTLGVSALPSHCVYFPSKYVNRTEIFDLLPVENVTWYDAVYYCNLLSKKEGLEQVYEITNAKLMEEDANGHKIKNIVSADVVQHLDKNGWRLPTEAEWEYAARGGDPSKEDWFYEYAGAKSQWTKTPKPEKAFNDGSDNGIDRVGWYSHNVNNGGRTGYARAQEGKEGFGPHQVGLKSPNRLGLYDMAGNVEEWCTDEFEQVYSLDGKTYKYHRVKDGCWSHNAEYLCVARRFFLKYDLHNQATGFRICRNR